MPPKQQRAMHRHDDRVASFQPIVKPKSRARHGWPLNTDTHPLLTPANMAHAGFYFSPGPSDASYDTCVCFLCGVRLGGWAEDDDPWMEHVSRGDCAWAETVCQVEVDKRGGRVATYASSDVLPSSSTSSRIRENTFYSKDRETCWWPHPEKDFKPTPSTLAEAGFVFTPTSNETDLVKCTLCTYEVEGWEAEDDPMAIHRNKMPDCPFFTAEVTGKGKRTNKQKQKADSEVPIQQPEAPSTQGHSRTNSRSQPTTTSGPGTRTRQQTSEAPSEPVKLHRSTRSRPKRGGGGKQTDDEVEIIDLAEEDKEDGVPEKEEEEEEEVVTKSKGSRRTKTTTSESKTRSKSSKKGKAKEEPEPEVRNEGVGATTDGTNDRVEPMVEPRVTGGEIDAEWEEDDKAKPKKKATSSKSSRKTIKAAESQPQADDEAPETADVDEIKDETEAKADSRSTSKTSSKSKSKAQSKLKSTETDPTVEEAEEPMKSKPVRKPRATKTSKKKAETQSQPLTETEAEAEKVVPAARPASPIRKPLPPLPDPSPRPLSQLERFTNLPSSPHSAPAPAPVHGRPTKSIPLKKGISVPTRAAQAAPLENGAKAARQVVDVSLSVVEKHTVRAEEGKGSDLALDLDMTLEQWIRAEMARKKNDIELEGREMIRAFEQRTKEGRRRIEAIPTR